MEMGGKLQKTAISFICVSLSCACYHIRVSFGRLHSDYAPGAVCQNCGVFRRLYVYNFFFTLVFFIDLILSRKSYLIYGYTNRSRSLCTCKYISIVWSFGFDLLNLNS